MAATSHNWNQIAIYYSGFIKILDYNTQSSRLNSKPLQNLIHGLLFLPPSLTELTILISSKTKFSNNYQISSLLQIFTNKTKHINYIFFKYNIHKAYIIFYIGTLVIVSKFFNMARHLCSNILALHAIPSLCTGGWMSPRVPNYVMHMSFSKTGKYL